MASEAKRNRVRELWLNLPETWRTHLVSAFNTFVATFIVSLLWEVSMSSDLSITKATLFAALGVAVRSIAVKPTTTLVMPEVMPDPKKK